MGRADARRARKRGGGRRRAKSKGGIRRFFTWRKLLGGFLAVSLLGVGTFLVLYIAVEIPDAKAEAKAQSNTYTYSDGTPIGRTGRVNRASVPLNRVPRDVQRSFVAAENKTFFQDSGIDLKGTARGLINTVTGGGKQGGSTITQQWVKNYFLSQEQTVSRKAKELIISLKVDQEKTKDEILEGYLNTSYYGRNAYGIRAAAKAYYDVDSDDLTVQQGAYLAALLQAPSQYEWTNATPTSRKLVLQRWNYVLNNMVEMDWLDSGEREGMKFPQPVPPKPALGLGGQAGYLVDAAEQELIASGVDERELKAGGGWNITLAIDKKKQKALEKAVERRLLADLDPEKRKVDANVQPGAVSVDPKKGEVVALYGGRDFVEHQISNATRDDYQPASTFKPLILAAAMENGAQTQDGRPITASTLYDGRSRRPVEGSGTAFAPPNEDNKSYGRITVQRAMNKSVNSVFAQMAVDVGLPEVKETATTLGLDPESGGFHVRPAMSLGVMGASPMDMAGVYATLANHGDKVTPRLVKSAERGEQTADLPDPVGEQAVDRETADSVTSVLRGVVDDGTGSAVRSADLEVAGKTGTSDDNKSAWFAGYTPNLVTAVGLFGEDSAQNGKQVTLRGAGGGGRVDGGGYPAKIWADYTRAALNGKPSGEFDLETGQGAAVPPDPAPTPTTSAPDPEPTRTQESETNTPDPTPTTSAPDTPTPTPSAPTEPPTSSLPPNPDPRPTDEASDGDEPLTDQQE
ncbi:transglycosylase domain-containing protein [Streptomyces sp. NPDC004647]|uniref:transglycosylase domain-containing protein n=1 Tax=Streptomyces sp. NPDC004647 TaxID=3154671 RepID=UPI0033ABA8B4